MENQRRRERSRSARRAISPSASSPIPTSASPPTAMPVIGRVLESPAAFGELTAEASEPDELPELEEDAPPPFPPPPPPPPLLEASTRIVPFICGWIVQM